MATNDASTLPLSDLAPIAPVELVVPETVPAQSEQPIASEPKAPSQSEAFVAAGELSTPTIATATTEVDGSPVSVAVTKTQTPPSDRCVFGLKRLCLQDYLKLF